MRRNWSRECCEQCGNEGLASRAEEVVSQEPYVCSDCIDYERAFAQGQASAAEQLAKAEQERDTLREKVEGLERVKAAFVEQTTHLHALQYVCTSERDKARAQVKLLREALRKIGYDLLGASPLVKVGDAYLCDFEIVAREALAATKEPA